MPARASIRALALAMFVALTLTLSGSASARPQQTLPTITGAGGCHVVDGSVDSWPAGSGYTAILASEPCEYDAIRLRQRVAATGLPAQILYSSLYRSLRPGYWVVWSGKFPSEAGALARVSRARQLGFSDAYVRYVRR